MPLKHEYTVVSKTVEDRNEVYRVTCVRTIQCTGQPYPPIELSG